MNDNAPTPTPAPQITDLAAIRDKLTGMVETVLSLDLEGAIKALYASQEQQPWSFREASLIGLLYDARFFQEAAARHQAERSSEFWARPGLPRGIKKEGA